MKQKILQIPVLGRIILFFYRYWMLLKHIVPYNWTAIKWLFVSRETTNFTANLDPLHEQYLAQFVAHITQQPYPTILGYFKELKEDKILEQHLLNGLRKSEEWYKADMDIQYGKRLAWYAFVRVCKPKVVVETGIDKGMGCCVLTAALTRNALEGNPGYYYGTDINPKAGYLLTAPYSDYGKVLYGDSIASLQQLQETIDLFINDSDHSADYEAQEYETIATKLAPQGIILGDNSEVTDKLFQFSLKHQRQFLFHKEVTIGHWFGGGGVGVSYNSNH